MTQRPVTESSEKTKHYVERRKTESDAVRSLQGGLPPVLQLQRTLGNRQVAKLIQNGRIAPEGRIIALQRKLTVGAADHPYEQEADRMARQVMNTSDAQVKAVAEGVRSTEGMPHHKAQTKPLALSIIPVAQQLKGNEHEVEEAQDKESDELIQAIPLSESAALPLQRQMATEDEESDTLQAKSAGALNGSFDAGTDVETHVSLSKGRGSPLPDPVRTFMEPRFSVDFSEVRVHTDSEAQQMNQSVGAQAFTHGKDIYFGTGRSPTQMELTAHELTHVVQQTGGRSLQSKKGREEDVDNADSLLQTLPAVPEEGRIARKESGSRGLAKLLTSQLSFPGQEATGTRSEFTVTKPASLSLNATSLANLTGLGAGTRRQTVPALSAPLPAELKGAVLSAVIGKAEVAQKALGIVGINAPEKVNTQGKGAQPEEAKPAVKAEVPSQSKVEPPAQKQQLSQVTENIPAVAAASPETAKASGETAVTATSKKNSEKLLAPSTDKAEKGSVNVKAAAGGAVTESEAEELSAGAAGKNMDRAPRTPDQDPDFQKAKQQVRIEAKKQKKGHDTASKKREEAELASALPSKEQENQSAKEKNTEVMEKQGAEQQNAGKDFSAKKFKDELLSLINTKQPTTESKAKEFAQNPPLEHFEEDFSKKVADEQGTFTAPLQEKATPEPSGGVPEKLEGDVPNPVFPPAPKPVDPKLAIPKPKTDQEISLEKEGERMDVAMQKNRLSDEQLAESREPSFIETLKLKQEARKKVSEAPAVYRRKESEILSGAETQTNESLSTELQGMGKIHQKIAKKIHGGQKAVETKTEKRQREIKEKIDGIYQGTVTSVTDILEGMAKKVKEDFANSLKQQTNLFNENVRSRISDYYGNWRIDDELFGPDDVVVLPDGNYRAMTLEEKFGVVKAERINPDVFKIFLKEKDKFIAAMNVELDKIAANVQTGLNAAHTAIQLGKANIAIFKATLKGDELDYANGLELEVQLKFDNLESSIDDAREDLLQTLADQYNENVNQLEKTFRDINDELKKSWIDRAVDFIETVGKTIYQLVELLSSILVRLAKLAWDIIKHPIRFFETLVSGLKQGIELFIQDIGTHLKEAFWTWITGATPVQNISLSAGSGIESLFGLVVQVLRLGPIDLRTIVEKVLGKEFMQMVDKGIAFAEKVFEPVTILLTQGPGPFWRYIQDTLGNIIQSSFDRIKESVFQAVIEKGLKWIAGFFIPGGGFVKIVKAIVSAFQFVAENLENIRQFFDSIFDSMEAAVEGRTEGVANKILSGIKKGMVLALDFLAKQLGFGKLVDSVQKIIQSLRRPIVNAIEWVLGKAKPFVTKLMKTGKALWDKGKAKVIGAGKAIVQVGVPEDPNERLRLAARASVSAARRLTGRVTQALLNPILAGIKVRYGLTAIQPYEKDGTWWVKVSINPDKHVDSGVSTSDTESQKESDKSTDPNRIPVIQGSGDTFSALDPAADEGHNLAGHASWEHGTGYVTVAVYPKDVRIEGKPPTEDTRMRGYPILQMLTDAIKGALKQASEGIIQSLPYITVLSQQQALKSEAEKYEIKGVRGVWTGDSTNLQEFNEFYKAGFSKEESAKKVWTGRQVKKLFSYENVEIEDVRPDPRDPNPSDPRTYGFEHVSCIFT